MTESQREMLAGERNPATSTGRTDSYLEVWTDNRHPANTIGNTDLQRVLWPDYGKPADTSANVRSTQDAIHVSIDLDVRFNGLPHHQHRWVESFQRGLL